MTSYLWTLGLNETSRGQTMASLIHTHTITHISGGRHNMEVCTHMHTSIQTVLEMNTYYYIHEHIHTRTVEIWMLVHGWTPKTHKYANNQAYSHNHTYTFRKRCVPTRNGQTLYQKNHTSHHSGTINRIILSQEHTHTHIHKASVVEAERRSDGDGGWDSVGDQRPPLVKQVKDTAFP